MTRALTVGRGGSVVDEFMMAAIEGTANAAHTAWVELRGATRVTGSADPTSGLPPTSSPLYWQGTARIQALSVPSQIEGAGDAISSRRYLVQIETDAEAGAGMQVAVINSTDPTLTGRTLIVRSATRSSTLAQRDLICTLESQEPTPPDISPVEDD